ncbi:hypothetical protein [Oceanobacillus sp. CFH 90083]|uniref:hypothetical protein n=1 Tax=Oceanobacillus sp. CFH 90083 TaxID=2592336 RepID=UPI00128D23AA|nr:hypothetical protein [Oceanobacillus sp. CFH 90083]
MKKYIKFTYCNFLLLSITFLLIACSNDTNQEKNNDSKIVNTVEKQGITEGSNPRDENDIAADDSSQDSMEVDAEDHQRKESETITSDENSAENEENNDSSAGEEENQNNKTLSSYSPEEMKYARVWLQLGPNQDIDELYIEHIPAGTPLDPNDAENDVSYPEEVIQISGSRITDGMITYSGNEDGTINVYDIPYGNRWYGGMPRPDDIDLEDVQEDMRDIIENTESVHIDPGNDEDVIHMIEKIYIIE